ncbi:MAG TPA: family membership, partial [Blastocatellia bacterium]|nr:family membership [Blastocatellia bacterium]
MPKLTTELLKSNPKPRSLIRRLIKWFKVLAMVAVIGVAALVAALWLEHRTEVTLPAPTGPFAVGRVTTAWIDDTHFDTLAPVPGTKRELLVWIWYPAAAPASPEMTSDYLPAAWRSADTNNTPAIFRLLTRDLSKVRAHSTADSAVSPLQRSYPVVLMRAGASAEVTNYTALAEDLASHGYVVVGFDAPYRTRVVVLPDGRVIARAPGNNPELCEGQEQEAACATRLLAAWTADMAFALDRLEELNRSDPSGKFTGRLDMTRVGVFGHSFGGAAAALFCHEDSRCKAGIDLDGAPYGSVIQAGIDRPFMFLLSDHKNESGAESRQILANIQSIYDRLPVDSRLRIA